MGLEGVLLPRIHHKTIPIGISTNTGQPTNLLSLRPHAKPVHEEEDTPRQEALPGQVSLSLMDPLFPIGSAECPEKYGIVHLRHGTGGLQESSAPMSRLRNTGISEPVRITAMPV